MRNLPISLLALIASTPWVRQVRGDDDPPVAEFLRRPFPSVIVIGDYLYIDGGEVSQLWNGQDYSDPDHPSFPVNSTLSISLKESWTNTTVTMQATNRTAPQLSSESLWRDPASDGFYVWGGDTSYFATPPPLELWKFTVDGNGGGAWAQQTPENIVTFSELIRATRGASAQTKDVAYYLGGYAMAQTDPSVTGSAYFALPGILAFNMTSGEFTNSSTAGLDVNGTLIGARSEFVPFGPNGLLLYLGGGQSPVVTDFGGWVDVDFDNLTFYDPTAEKWYSQETTGARPTPRDRFCAVSAQGPNNTFEIFMYGGVNTPANTIFDEVYVLSLPGFVFFQANGTSTVRADHDCAVIGNRQMVSVGGSDATTSFPQSLTDPDPLKDGIGIFDMTAMQWSSGYDAGAAAYDSPDIVKQWYSEGGLASVKWSSDEVKNLFAQAAPSGTSSNPSSSTGSNSTTHGNGEKSSSSHVGAIAGGVVGGVAALAILGIILFFFLRRRTREANQLGHGQGQPAMGELPGEWQGDSSGLRTYNIAAKGKVTPYPRELDSVPPAELPADHGFSELN